ncbi:MAG: XTP/dITP diphosphatase [Syntrophales bacterium]
MKRIVIASKNPGKIKELQALFAGTETQILSLNDFPDVPEIIEDGKSFYENAFKKAKAVAEATGETALADDSGLEVEALGGAPGIYSARYAGEGANDRQNVLKLLGEMRGVPAGKRGAAFRCVLVLYNKDNRHESFEGRWEGMIAENSAGEGGFGYDPIFYLPQEGMTVAQLSPELKNMISHRAQAFIKLKRSWNMASINQTGRSAAR